MVNTTQRVSLIATVRNERDALDAWLGGIEQQERLPDEIVIVDGGSTDGTWEALSAWDPPARLILIQKPDTSIAEGRNLAFRRATGDVIAITDCGTVAAPDWLERLVQPFDDANVDVVSGFFEPVLGTRWERVLAAGTLPDAGEVSADRFLPSSRSVAIRAGWVRGGFEYPEWLDYCEDLIWDMRLRDAGARFALALDAVVAFRVRQSPSAFWRQYYLYARGDGKAGLFGKRHAIRYGTYLVATLIAARRRPVELALGVMLGSAYLSRPARRLWRRDRDRGKSPVETLLLAAMLPAVVALGDVAKMAGYPVGVWWRLRKFGTLNPAKNWRRVRSDGRLWNPGRPLDTPRRQTDSPCDQARSPERQT